MYERLTRRDKKGVVYAPAGKPPSYVEFTGISADRFAAYEDSELSPEEVHELAKAKAEGRLIILPCKVGDILELRVMGTVQKYRFMGIIQQEGYLPSLYGRQLFGKFQDVPIAMVESFGKTVFLTREAAEKVLGGGEG